MPWFKVDDGFCFHPKAIAAGNAALGLWVRAGSWCGANLTEGWLPTAMVGTLGAQKRDAMKLVHSGLWIHTGPTPDAHTPNTSGTPAAHQVGHEGDMSECSTCGLSDGYQFRDWDEYQPTKAQVEAERKAARERQARHREGKRHGVSHAVTDTVTNAVSHGTPTRPDPTSSSSGTTSGDPQPAKPASIPRSRGAGTRIPDPFIVDEAMRDWAVDRGYTAEWCMQQTERFINYWTAKAGKDGVKADWRATWRNWILKAADDLPANKPQGDLFDRAMERAQQRLEIVQ